MKGASDTAHPPQDVLWRVYLTLHPGSPPTADVDIRDPLGLVTLSSGTLSLDLTEERRVLFSGVIDGELVDGSVVSATFDPAGPYTWTAIVGGVPWRGTNRLEEAEDEEDVYEVVCNNHDDCTKVCLCATPAGGFPEEHGNCNSADACDWRRQCGEADSKACRWYHQPGGPGPGASVWVTWAAAVVWAVVSAGVGQHRRRRPSAPLCVTRSVR